MSLCLMRKEYMKWGIKVNFLRKVTCNRNLFICDIILNIFSYITTALVIYPRSAFESIFVANWIFAGASVVIFIGMAIFFGCYKVYWIYGGTREYLKLLMSCVIAGAVVVVLSYVVSMQYVYPKMWALASVLSAGFMLGLRMFVRVLCKLIRISICESRGGKTKRVIIVGAGSLGVTLVRDISGNSDLNYEVLGFVDDDKAKHNLSIQGIKVLGGLDDIEDICRRRVPDEIIIAISNVSASDKRRIVDLCGNTHCKLKILPGLADSLRNKNSYEGIREVEVEDLLERDPIVLDNGLIAEDIKSHVIMVTGGGGSIGSELCRQIAKYSPKKLVILDIYENGAFDLQNELAEIFPDCETEIAVSSVCDEERMDKLFDTYKPHIVFHAAAHKHVPMMETNAPEAVKNNVFGTYITAKCADKHNAKRFVLISTDKAVKPTNVMGATKRVCEMIIQAMQKVSKTEFVAVRFGNVLNSNGSVLPRFKRQIKKGGPITVTHRDITRFFMTIPEAAQLVIKAAACAKGGEIFVLDMGEPVKIYDLAKNLIHLSGLEEGTDIKIEIVGLRPGEKLYEELLMEEEGLQKTGHNKIYIGKPFFDSYEELQKLLDILKEAVKTEDNDIVKEAVKKVVPTYMPQEKSNGGQNAGNCDIKTESSSVSEKLVTVCKTDGG